MKTDIREMETQESREAQRMLQHLIGNLPGFVYRCANDPQWTIFYITEGCRKITGYTPEDLTGSKVIAYADLIHPNYRDASWSRWQEVLAHGGTLETEYPIITASGETRWLWERGSVVADTGGKILYLEGFVTDITDRKKTEEEYSHLFELSPAAILMADTKGTIVKVNDTYRKLMGYEWEELVGQNVRMFVPPEDRHQVDINLGLLLAGEKLEHEVTSLTRTGERRRCILRERAITLPDGEVRILSLATDVTALRNTEDKLQQSEGKYRALIEDMLEGMLILNYCGEILFSNPAARAMVGQLTDADVSSGPLRVKDFMHASSVKQAIKDIEAVRQGQDLSGQYMFVRKDGQVGWVEAYGKGIDYEGKEALLVLGRDITQRKEAETVREFHSWHDALTELHNRRYFEKIMEEWALPTPGVIVVDLDGLKLINDTLGHPAGDELLKISAGMIKQYLPRDSVAARIGGDEFVCLIPGATEADIETIIRNIRLHQAQYNQLNPELPLSLSMGYAVTEAGVGRFDAFKSADNNMYRDKLFHQQSSRSALVLALMSALESKNIETREHVERMAEIASAMARRMGYPENSIPDLDLFARFHDIGKVGVADSILNKPGPLNELERIEMQRHSEIGYRIAVASPELATTAELILKHHEWFDGTGYPLGLKGEQIPLECRIVAIADAYDAMTSDRPYRKALSQQAALSEIVRHAGTQFDPQLVELFEELMSRQ